MAEATSRRIRFAVIGVDHRHIFEMTGRLLELGHECTGYWTDGEPQPLAGFIKRYPHIPRVADKRRLIEDPTVALILTAAVPCDRAAIAIEAMRAGKDVGTDKPGCTTLAQLAELRRVVAETGRIWSVNYSERFEVAAATRALELVRAGAIGRVVQTVGLGPHRINRHLRREWFFRHDAVGGILADIGCHQVDSFMTFTGSTDAEIVHAAIGNFANPDHLDYADYGEMVLGSPQGRGFVRLDYYTPDGQASWGDGRFFVLGTDGYMELRQELDIAGREGPNHLFVVDNKSTRYIDCRDAGLPYYPALVADVLDRTDTAMVQSYCFRVMEIAMQAEAKATRLGYLAR
jgi:predicted dehydrogenase